jgi:hypothetical protein
VRAARHGVVALGFANPGITTSRRIVTLKGLSSLVDETRGLRKYRLVIRAERRLNLARLFKAGIDDPGVFA